MEYIFKESVLAKKAEAHLVSGVLAEKYICRENILAAGLLMGAGEVYWRLLLQKYMYSNLNTIVFAAFFYWKLQLSSYKHKMSSQMDRLNWISPNHQITMQEFALKDWISPCRSMLLKSSSYQYFTIQCYL